MQPGRAPEVAPEQQPVPGQSLQAWAHALTGWLSRLVPRLATKADVESTVRAAIAKHIAEEH